MLTTCIGGHVVSAAPQLGGGVFGLSVRSIGHVKEWENAQGEATSGLAQPADRNDFWRCWSVWLATPVAEPFFDDQPGLVQHLRKAFLCRHGDFRFGAEHASAAGHFVMGRVSDDTGSGIVAEIVPRSYRAQFGMTEFALRPFRRPLEPFLRDWISRVEDEASIRRPDERRSWQAPPVDLLA